MTLAFRPTGPVYTMEVLGGTNGFTYPGADSPNVVLVTNTGADPAVAWVAPDADQYAGVYSDWPTTGQGVGMVVMPGTSVLLAVNTTGVNDNLNATASTFPGGDAGNVLFTSGSLE